MNELERQLKESENARHELAVGRRVAESRRAVRTGKRPLRPHSAKSSGTRVWLDSSQDSTHVVGEFVVLLNA